MATLAKPEPHAITRLRERFGVELTIDELRRLASQIGNPAAKYDPRRFKYVNRVAPDRTAWLVNFADFVGHDYWIPLIFGVPYCEVVTALPYPANMTVAEFDAILRDRMSLERKGQKPPAERRHWRITYQSRRGAQA
jgi:hypothetical protein